MKGIISCVAAEAAVLSATCYLLPLITVTLAGAGGSVNIINMTVISPVPHCMEKLVLGRKMKHLSPPTSLLLLLLQLVCCERLTSVGLDGEKAARGGNRSSAQ